MPDVKEMTIEDMKPYLTGKNAHVGSVVYNEVKLEYERRMAKKEKVKHKQLIKELQRGIKSTNNLTDAVKDLKETWQNKLIWLGVVAISVGIAIEIFSTLAKKWLKL